MSSVPEGWQPLSKPRRRQGADAFHLSPFARLARAHLFSAAGDALVTIALAGSLFFDLDPNDARWKIVLYLALTMAPLALVAPFIGPALDRSHGGRRWMIVAVNAVRALVCLVMLDDLDSLLLFPEAFTVLAMGKAYGVARSALVPTVVRNDDELVEANSKLQLLSGLAAPTAGLLAAPAYLIARSQGVLALAVVAYLCGTVAALRIPTTQVAAAPVSEAEAIELRGIGIRLAATAMALIRGVVGFLTMLLLFELRDGDTWRMGVVLAFSGAGTLIGSALAPRLRRSFSEERMLMALLGALVGAGLGAAWAAGLPAYALLSATVAIVATGSRMAFDSIVQRDAPDANRGRSFARFEVRFQLAWVVAALLPLLFLPIPVRVAFIGIALTAAFALFSYLAGQRAARRAHDAAQDLVEAEVDVGFRDDDRTQPLAPDPTAAAPDPTVPDAPRSADPDDLASWQVSDPTWGADPTEVDPETTNVKWWPRRR
ncbi:MAG TPA: MFS transporter [Acidimicrobiales bacterium]|nr:MFS transporter [Acidimicrobiales bacterium]